MFDPKGAALFILAESPVHWGTGASLGAVDLPIQRERHTDYPMGQSAGIKGSLRDLFERHKKEVVDDLFGPEPKPGEEARSMGQLAFGDARILLFPVRSGKGAFAWIACPRVISRLRADLSRAGIEGVPGEVPNPPENGAWTTKEGMKYLALTGSPQALIEDRAYTLQESDGMAPWSEWLQKTIPEKLQYHRARLKDSLLVVSDDDFKSFVRQGTIVETHVAIENETRTAKEGALFQAEFVPSDALFYSVILAAGLNRPAPRILDDFRDGLQAAGGRWQMGADASTGRGWVVLNLVRG